MEELDPYYFELIRRGLPSLQKIIVYVENYDWAKIEAQMLHNIPSLIGEKNLERHRYYWFVEREWYLKDLAALKHDESFPEPDYAVSCMEVFYMPIWKEMEPIVLRLLNNHESSEDILKENPPE